MNIQKLAAYTVEMDKIADEIQESSPLVAWALDRVSDELDGMRIALGPSTTPQEKSVEEEAPKEGGGHFHIFSADEGENKIKVAIEYARINKARKVRNLRISQYMGKETQMPAILKSNLKTVLKMDNTMGYQIFIYKGQKSKYIFPVFVIAKTKPWRASKNIPLLENPVVLTSAKTEQIGEKIEQKETPTIEKKIEKLPGQGQEVPKD